MDTKRQKQIGEVVRRHFSQVLLQDGRYIYQDTLVTVTGVKMTSDLGIAKVYLSVYNTENKQAVILLMEEQNVQLRQALAHRIKRRVRRIPELQFYIDETLDEMYRLNNLFGRLKAENQMGEEE